MSNTPELTPPAVAATYYYTTQPIDGGPFTAARRRADEILSRRPAPEETEYEMECLRNFEGWLHAYIVSLGPLIR